VGGDDGEEDVGAPFGAEMDASNRLRKPRASRRTETKTECDDHYMTQRRFTHTEGMQRGHMRITRGVK